MATFEFVFLFLSLLHLLSQNVNENSTERDDLVYRSK